MKKIPIIAGAAIGIVVLVIMPAPVAYGLLEDEYRQQ